MEGVMFVAGLGEFVWQKSMTKANRVSKDFGEEWQQQRARQEAGHL